ncbi:hypothetical protein LWE61_01560 [Sphingobium sufflavum]|nr:hypothetical protein [Sphingobium sufflavum]MCE7795237.1 hypothetical protein [Sphingobium sufflavum]
MPIAHTLPQLSLDEIEELDAPIALFACGEASESLQIAQDAIIISLVFHR